MTWMLVVLSIVGVILNIYHHRYGFLFWMIANLGWMIIDFLHELYAQAFLFGVYFLLAFWGWLAWEK